MSRPSRGPSQRIPAAATDDDVGKSAKRKPFGRTDGADEIDGNYEENDQTDEETAAGVFLSYREEIFP